MSLTKLISLRRITTTTTTPSRVILHSRTKLALLDGITRSSSTSSCKNQTDRDHRDGRRRLVLSISSITLGVTLLVIPSISKLLDRSDHQCLSIDRYGSFEIRDSKTISSDTRVLEIDARLSKSLDPIDHLFYIESVYLKHPALQIERPYTPLSSITPQTTSSDQPGQARLQLLVKRYPDGDMSTYVHHLKPRRNQIELRGPVPTWCHPKGDIDEIVFIAGGTGITPAIQLIRRIFKQSSSQLTNQQEIPKFQLLYLTRALESAYLLDEIKDLSLKHSNSFQFKLVVEDKSDKLSSTTIDKLGRIELSDLRQWVGQNDPQKKRIIIVCGPDSLVCAVAGCKGRQYNSQGEIGGMLKKLGYSSHQVIKL